MCPWCYGRAAMRKRIVAVVGDKGGIGKSALAYELAAALRFVLVDLDWSGGGVTGSWGLEPRGHRPHFLVNATAPHVYRRGQRPDLIPSVPALADVALPRAEVGERLKAIEHSLVIDTHPGFNVLTLAAVDVADLLVVPVLLRERELNALDRMLMEGLAASPVVIVPNMVPPATPRRQLERLQRILEPYRKIPVAPPVSWWPWWSRRRRRAALVLEPSPGEEARRAVVELRDVATEVRRCLA